MPGAIPKTCLFANLLDFIWPRSCAICGRSVDRPARYICSDCLNRLPFTPTDGCCRKCGRDVPALDGEFLCSDCRATRPAFDRVGCAVRFECEARTLINAYKFQHNFWLRDDFVDWLEAAAHTRFRLEKVDCVLPMPSTFWHRFSRGFSPCAYLTRALACRLRKSYQPFVLCRTGHPRRQGGLDEESRRTNVRGTFKVRLPHRIAGKTVLVVDDIMTTGSTLSEAASELKRAGAACVWGLTVARTFRT